MSPASVRGDPRGEVFSSRGRGWGAKTRRGIPRCHLYTHSNAPAGTNLDVTLLWSLHALASFLRWWGELRFSRTMREDGVFQVPLFFTAFFLNKVLAAIKGNF
jgi:hypothetical protein